VNPEDDVEALVSEVEVLERRAQEPCAPGGDVRRVPLRRSVDHLRRAVDADVGTSAREPGEHERGGHAVATPELEDPVSGGGGERLDGVGLSLRGSASDAPSLVDQMIDQLVEQIESRFAELSEQMADPEVIGDRERYAEVGRAWRALEPAHALAREYRQAQSNAAGARELLAEEGDDSGLRAELEAAEARLAELDEEIRLAMVERDPNDDKNVIVEVRAGAGGEEAGLFAGDLYRMLTRYAERRGFRVEPISLAEGAFTFAVKGDGAYSVFKHEGGTHRVQRIPQTESQGRIHTSTATVAVLPEAEEVEVDIDQNDLQVDVYRSSGPGGQSVNTTDSAVRITHKPTGLVVSMQDEKSQLQNREKAMRVLRARLLEQQVAAQQAELSADRRAQVGTGERAEKVRTYNFPQDRVTDHRVKLTRGNLEGVLAGELEELTAALEAEEKRLKLAAGELIAG
jgi:peptide chain release factor 1